MAPWSHLEDAYLTRASRMGNSEYAVSAVYPEQGEKD